MDDFSAEWSEFFQVIHGLAARAFSTFAEILWLLRGGYPRGAAARLRTLEEITLTSAVLFLHGMPGGDHPELVERFDHHSRIFLRKASSDILATNHEGLDEILDSATVDEIEQLHTRLLDRYGSKFKEPWGWAAPLFGGKAPKGHEVARLVDWRHWDYLYGTTSAEVHGGSQGWHETFINRRTEGTIMLAGATNYPLAPPAIFGVVSLDRILIMILSLHIERDGMRVDQGDEYASCIRHLLNWGVEELSAADDAVEQAEIRLPS